MKDKEKQEKVFDILNKFEFFQGQRAGRELWNDKPKEVQDKDIADFVEDINYIRSYLQDSVVLSREEYEKLKKQLTKARSEKKRFKNKCLALETNKECYIAQARKETAEKILNSLLFEVKVLDDYESVGKFDILGWLEELAEQSGVEIKE